MGMIRKTTLGFQNVETADTLDTPEKLRDFAMREEVPIEPLDVKKLAEKIGIEVYFVGRKDGVSGILQKVGEQWIILVNKNHHPNRQRYTIAHELGHYCMHRREETFFEDQIFFRNLDRTRTETQANRFASELLMPKILLEKYIQDGTVSVDKLAELFGVSTLALRIRAKDLGYSETKQ